MLYLKASENFQHVDRKSRLCAMSREEYICWEYSTGAQLKTTLEWPLIGSGDSVIIANEVVHISYF